MLIKHKLLGQSYDAQNICALTKGGTVHNKWPTNNTLFCNEPDKSYLGLQSGKDSNLLSSFSQLFQGP